MTNSKMPVPSWHLSRMVYKIDFCDKVWQFFTIDMVPMLPKYVFSEALKEFHDFVTLTELIWLLLNVCFQMTFRIIYLWDNLVTVVALDWFLRKVDYQMTFEITIFWESLFTLAEFVYLPFLLVSIRNKCIHFQKKVLLNCLFLYIFFPVWCIM